VERLRKCLEATGGDAAKCAAEVAAFKAACAPIASEKPAKSS
jgi:hypothetical protein